MTPIRIKRPCSHPGCRELIDRGRCAAHQVKADMQRAAQVRQYDQTRGTAAQRGYDARWQKYSVWYRQRNPLCVHCLAEGRLTSVEHGGHVDHITPVTGPDDPLFWDPTNHQSLCTSCHSVKTASEDGGFGNR